MIKLYFGNGVAIISTLFLGVNIAYMLFVNLNRTIVQKWGLLLLAFILLHGLFWYFANIRDLYSNSITYATNHLGTDGLFSANSIQSIIFWIVTIAIWILGIIAIFKPQYRKNIFYIITLIAIIQIAFIEYSRIRLYYTMPSSFDYM